LHETSINAAGSAPDRQPHPVSDTVNDPTADEKVLSTAERRFALSDKIYQRGIWPTIERVSHGNPSNAPIVVDLDPTTFCDLGCPECISGSLLNQTRFTHEELKRLAEQIADAGVRGVILIGGGEPLAHPGVGRVIKILGERGIKLGLVTNGTLIHRHLEPIATYVDWVRVSVDAGTADTYQIFRPSRRGKNMFEEIISNLRLLSPRRKETLGYSFLIMSRPQDFAKSSSTYISNVHDLLTAGHLAKDIGCDYLEIKAMLDPHHFVDAQPPEVVRSLQDQLQHLVQLENPSFQTVLNSTAVALLKREQPVQNKAYTHCPVAELRTLITPQGVYVCPYHRGDSRFRLGDVRDGFMQVWAASSRKIVNPSKDCTFHCARHRTNLAIQQIDVGLQGRDMVSDYDPFI